VGPDDPSGRFTYWPVRIDRGGEVAAPGAGSDPVQIIDVRDLAAWIVQLIETPRPGIFNATGPGKRLPWGNLLSACQNATAAKAALTWIPPAFLAGRKDFEFPIWAPYTGETRGTHTHSNVRAVKAGLRFRPIEATVRDTLAWYKSQPAEGRVRLAGPTPEQEAALLAAWRAGKS
jgi:2'-hydroxyisoflavone reductase